jgi:hypothetical protein
LIKLSLDWLLGLQIGLFTLFNLTYKILDMKNVFNFEYELAQLTNKNGSISRFGVVYGDGGNIIHTKKDTYTVVLTSDVSQLARVFTENGYNVKPFSHKSGEVIGLNINIGHRPTKVGDKQYLAIITVPNNGTAKGYLTIQEHRLICSNGATRTAIVSDGVMKIPHNVDYKWAVDQMGKSILAFYSIVEAIEKRDYRMNDDLLDRETLRYRLNEWFFFNEFPESQKNGISFDRFRELVVTNPSEIKCIDRYNELLSSCTNELRHNDTLGLKMSAYTLYATITNYLSRRIAKSGSSAPTEIQFERASVKLKTIELAYS